MEERGSGRALFASVMLLLTGVLNVIYGIAAIGDSTFFVEDTKYILSNLNTWGWVALILGIVQIIAGVSVSRGGFIGVVFGITVAGLGAIAALLSIPAYPFWSIAIFALDIWIISGLTQYAGDVRRPGGSRAAATDVR
jgi:hypothetical protein